MAENLEDLFCQIIHSERKAEERKNYLHGVKLEITKCQDEIQEIGEDIMSRKGELVMKVEQLNEEELKVNWLTNREKIFLEQKENLHKESGTLKMELKELDDILIQEVNDFCRSVKQFSFNYDLSGKGRQRRESSVKESLAKNKEIEKQLTQEVTEFSEHLTAVQHLNEELQNLHTELDSCRNKEKELQQRIDKESRKLKELDEKRKSVANMPQTDEEFSRIEMELNNLKSDELQKKCIVLNQELQSLRQKLWRRDIHRKWSQKRPEHDSNKKSAQSTAMYSNKLTIGNFLPENVCQNSTDNEYESSEKFSDDDIDDLFDENMMDSCSGTDTCCNAGISPSNQAVSSNMSTQALFRPGKQH